MACPGTRLIVARIRSVANLGGWWVFLWGLHCEGALRALSRRATPFLLIISFCIYSLELSHMAPGGSEDFVALELWPSGRNGS